MTFADSTPATQQAHAKFRAPSSAKRWINCPLSAKIGAMYDRDDTDASLKGTYWHEVMEDTLKFGFVPKNVEPDLDDAMQTLLDYVKRRVAEMRAVPGAGEVRIFIEKRLDIPCTGEFGTVDVLLVSMVEYEVLDLKAGYVPVDVHKNPQMLNYLDGAIGLFGMRDMYRITIYQPNYDHRDGPIRTYVVSSDDMTRFWQDVEWSMQNPDTCVAGPWCKETYCEHRGACSEFIKYVQDDLALGWYPSEVKGMSDAALAEALDASDQAAGLRNELRAEAMRRIMQMDRKIEGYKVVNGGKQRTIVAPAALVDNVRAIMGVEWAVKLFPTAQWAGEALKNVVASGRYPEDLMKTLGTAKHIENIIREFAKANDLPRGMWKSVYSNVVGAYIRETVEGKTLEKAINGRPAHKRGGEFGSLGTPLAQVDTVNKGINVL